MEKWFLLILILCIGIVYAQDDMFAREATLDESAFEDFEDEEMFIEEEIIENKAGITPDSPLYVVDTFIDDVRLTLKKGKDKAEFALKVTEEKVAEAKLMVDKNKPDETKKALARAHNISTIIEQEASPDLQNETNERMAAINAILKEMEESMPADWDEVKSMIDAQSTQADKNKMAVELAAKIQNLCEKLALQDWKLMEAEPRCDIDNALDWLDEYIGDDLKDREEKAKEGIMDGMAQCFIDPRECDCSKIPVKSHRKVCEKAVPLAIECEFEFNQRACDELDTIEMPEGFEDKEFTEHVREKEREMFDDFMPPECVREGLTTQEECEELMFEIYGSPPDECMENGEFIGPMECEEIMVEIYGPTPLQCLDEDGIFIGEQECMDIMLPQECKDAGAYSREECKEIMMEIMLPPECLEAGATTEEECMEIILPPECKEAGAYSKEECEEIMGDIYGPTPPECLDENDNYIGDEECIAAINPECAEAGGTTFDDCEGMWGDEGGDSNTMPRECMDNGQYIGMHACEEAMWDMMGRPPEECFREGQYIGGDYCKQLTGVEYAGAHPDECVEGDMFIGHEECAGIMGWGEEGEEGEFGPSPPECLDEIGWYVGDEECMKRIDPGCVSLGASNWEECHNMMKERYGASPDECFEGEGMGFIGELKCAVIIEELYGGEGKFGTAPEYCFDESGEYVGDEECSRRNDERGGPGGEGGPGEGGPPDYCYEDGEYIGNDACSALHEEFFQGEVDHGTAPDYCFDESDNYVGDDACSSLNDQFQE